MIDLTRTEQDMLAEIRTEGSQPGARSSATPDALTPEKQLEVRGTTPDELLPMLMDTFSTRYVFLPSDHGVAELNYLVKKGLGNAYKWGNEGAEDRKLTVRAVMTDAGAVVAIGDEGRGFDVPNVLSRFLRKDAYSRHGGSGFFHFHEARSVISYADGGRTLLIRFLCSAEPKEPAPADPVQAGVPRPVRRRVELGQLAVGSQVKIKGGLKADGRFVAEKVSLKAAEEWAVIDAVIRGVTASERRISVLDSMVTLPEGVDIRSPEQRRLDLAALRAGQVVELTGSYSPENGFQPLKVQIRHDSAPPFEEIQGRIDAVNAPEGTVRLLGITVTFDEKTHIKDKRS